MIEFISSFFGKSLGSFAKPAWEYGKKIFTRPTLKLRKTPENLLDYLKPSASKGYVIELLGEPHQVVNDSWFYRFNDALVQIEFWPNSGAKYIALGLVGNSKKHYFPIPIFNKKLGQLSIEDVRQEQDSLRYRSSLRHEDVLVEFRFGPTGAWLNWTFGATMAVGSQTLHESYFEWNQDENRLNTAQSMVLVNWVAVSNSSEEVYFDWSFS